MTSLIDSLRNVRVDPREGGRPFGAPTRHPGEGPNDEKYEVTSMADTERLQNLSRVLEGVGKVTSHEPIAQNFIDVGEGISRELEKIGDMAFEEGERRKAEYYKMALAVRDKCRYQAAEALAFIAELSRLQEPKKPSVASVLDGLKTRLPEDFKKDIDPHHIPDGR